MTVHIIHLPHRTDRIKALHEELTAQQASDYRLWPGIVDPMMTCRGISRAHKQIVAYAKANHLEKILIAEDDVHFVSTDSLHYYFAHLPQYFDIYLGGITWGTINDDRTVDDFAGTFFYMVHRSFYDRLLSLPEERDIDRARAGFRCFVICNPMIAITHNGYSDNLKKEMDYSHYFTRRNFLP